MKIHAAVLDLTPLALLSASETAPGAGVLGHFSVCLHLKVLRRRVALCGDHFTVLVETGHLRRPIGDRALGLRQQHPLLPRTLTA
jgi:hypothetical protein